MSFYPSNRRTKIFSAIAGTLAALTVFGTTIGATVPTSQAQAATSSISKCTNPLARTLFQAGFRGENLREAWAIAMRESNGTNLGPGMAGFNGHDYGLFQFNKPSWGGQKWWKDKKVLHGVYNARVAYKYSHGGRDWGLWGLDGQGHTKAAIYRNVGWSSSEIYSWITEPYQRYYRQFAPLASRCM